MVWSPRCAANAYLDTLKLCKASHERSRDGDGDDDDGGGPLSPIQPQSNEFISALAAGMSAKLIVQVSTEASESTVALAAAARQTGGRLICILPEHESVTASEQVINDSGLNSVVEFKSGNPHELLREYENIDFSLVDCKEESNTELLKLLDVNPRRSMVVANNLVGKREGLGGGDDGGLKERYEVRSVKHPIGDGMEVTMIGKSDEFGINKDTASTSNGISRRESIGGDRTRTRLANRRRLFGKNKWVKRIDQDSGEEHIFRIPKSL